MFTPAYRGKIFFLPLEGRVRLYRLEAGREVTVAVSRVVELLFQRLSFYEQTMADIALERVPAGLVRVVLQLVEQDAEELRRAAEDAS